MDERWQAEQEQRDDLGDCAFWFQVERARAAPVESGAISHNAREPKDELERNEL